MSDPLRTDGSRAVAAASQADRDAKIEQLLLAGLDHYFAAQYDHAISVWTRVLFLDRSHARARAYIERARSALAERQRESEELLQRGVAALQRGDAADARRLVQAAIDTGAPSDEAFAVLNRLARLDVPRATDPPLHARRLPVAPASPVSGSWRQRMWSGVGIVLMFLAAAFAAGAYSLFVWGPLDWATLLPLHVDSPRAAPAAASPVSHLPPPRRGELAMARARTLAAGGQLRDALSTLDLVRVTDPEKADAERLRAEIQLQLIRLASGSAVADGRTADRSAR